MEVEIFFTQKRWKKANLVVIDADGSEFFPEVRRVFSPTWQGVLHHVRFQYKAYELNLFKRALLTMKYQFAFYKRNKLLAFIEAIYGFKLHLDLPVNTKLPLRVLNNETRNEFWISREAITNGIYSTNLSVEIEWSRERFASSYEGFIWKIKSHSTKSINFGNSLEDRQNFELHRISGLNLVETSTQGALSFHHLTNCKVVGGLYSIDSNRIYYLDSTHREDNNSHPTNLLFTDSAGISLFVNGSAKTKQLNKAVLMGSSSSWFHFIVEILPRFLIAPNLQAKEYHLIVRGRLPQSILEILNSFGFKSIVNSDDAEVIEVNELLTVTDLRYKESLYLPERREDLELVRNYLSSLSDPSEAHKKILISRPKNLFRPLLNRNKLEKLLVKRGFEIAHPQELSVVEQINLFQSSRIVIAESGAAMTNLMFMKPGSKVLEIHPMDDVAGFWSTYGKFFDVDVYVCQGTQSFFRRIINGDAYFVDLELLNQLLDEIDN